MHIGIICPEVPGHLNPMTTLGGELKRRGHDVTVLGTAMARDITTRAGLAFDCLGEDDPMSYQLAEAWKFLGSCSGFRSMAQTGKAMGLSIQLVLKYVPELVDTMGIDGLIVDQTSPAGCVVAEEHGIPFVIAANALAMHWDPLLPPPALPWNYRPDWIGRVRNTMAKAFVARCYSWLSDQKTTGVDPLMLIFEPDHGLAQIAQQPSFFNFPRFFRPEHLHFTGPWHTLERDDAAIPFPWDWLDGRPLIYASMGTLQNKLAFVFEAIIEAVRDLPMQVVLSQGGGRVDIKSKIPDHVLLVERAPQVRLLQRASLVITHAGLNTTLESLASGVPMLCLPVTNDQPGVSKRVEWLGNGRVIPFQRVTAARLKAELAQMLKNPDYAAKAKELQSRLSEFSGIQRAADIVERALTTRQPVLSEEFGS